MIGSLVRRLVGGVVHHVVRQLAERPAQEVSAESPQMSSCLSWRTER